MPHRVRCQQPAAALPLAVHLLGACTSLQQQSTPLPEQFGDKPPKTIRL